MLGRLLKYELKSTARIFIPIYFFAFTANLIFLFSQSAGDQFHMLKFVMSIIIGIGYFGMLIACLFMTANRFYESMFANEGYLTHTLPVSIHKLISSKLLISLFWYLVGTLIFTVFAYYNHLYSADGKFIIRITSSYPYLSFIASTLTLLMFSMLIYASISIVQMFHSVRDKFLTAAFIVIVSTVAYYFLTIRLQTLFPEAFINMYDIAKMSESDAILHHFTSFPFALDVAIFLLLYCTTSWCLKHRLNIE
ncbi:MAG: hypothetical protein Q4A41_06515 [Bacillota bacterium]|nr:hypothetical protein [Bacillota bacterium]